MVENQRNNPYEDIINLPHHISRKHPQMSISDRAAQFSPFAALTGFGAEIQEAARLTDCQHELSEDQKGKLNDCLRLLNECLPKQPEAVFTYFLPDRKKDGGSYVTVKGKLKRLDEVNRLILLSDGTSIPIESMLDVQCEALHMEGIL